MNYFALSEYQVIFMNKEVLACGYSYHNSAFFQCAHPLDSYLIRVQTSGKSTAVVNGNELLFETGDLLLAKKGMKYELRIGKITDGHKTSQDVSSSDFYLLCDGKWIENWWQRSKRPLHCNIELHENVLFLWRQLIDEKNKAGNDHAELQSYLLRTLCLYLDKAVNETFERNNSSFTASRIKRYIERHACKTFKVADAAAYVGLSVSRSSRLFKQYYNKTIMQYALEYRLQNTVDRMKHTTMTLEEIADSCGFGSYTFFHKSFKARYGLSPTEFRNQIF